MYGNTANRAAHRERTYRVRVIRLVIEFLRIVVITSLLAPNNREIRLGRGRRLKIHFASSFGIASILAATSLGSGDTVTIAKNTVTLVTPINSASSLH